MRLHASPAPSRAWAARHPAESQVGDFNRSGSQKQSRPPHHGRRKPVGREGETPGEAAASGGWIRWTSAMLSRSRTYMTQRW